MFFLVLFLKPVDNLPLFESAMSDRCQHGIPVAESVFLLHDLLIFRLHDIGKVHRFGTAACRHHLTPADDIFLFELFLKPGIDLGFRLRTLYDIQPVTARSSRILGRQYLDTITVLDLVIDIDQFAVHSCADHLISDGAVDRIGKINRRRTIRQVLDISVRCKTVDVLRKQIQISF